MGGEARRGRVLKASRVSQKVFLGESTAEYVDEAFARLFVMRYTTRHPDKHTLLRGTRASLRASLLGQPGGNHLAANLLLVRREALVEEAQREPV